jgi:hypothetical protein
MNHYENDLKVLTAVPKNNIIPYDIMPTLVEAHWYFLGMFCFQLQAQRKAKHATNKKQAAVWLTL